ncbi:zinc finger protein 830 [Puntigrus tetrazona]|uniref:zinc finger protein 830 n=1 Tax=Puntigrus tetrazona TaxID=1606681 RepID=UPI001C8A87C4|nr:zinc finger protein 830 [Puntigrus tetrazona]
MTSLLRDEPAKMASLKKGKKVVNQDDLRRLMKEKKQSSERQKRVESPYAKYNSVGQLSCALCNAPLKSALLWQTHVLGKQHKDKVSELKNRESTNTPAAPSPSPSSSSSALKRKRPAPENTSTSGTPVQPPRAAAAGGLGLLAGHYDDDDDDEGEGGSTKAEAGLPLDFFDSSAPPAVSHSGSVSKAEEEEKKDEERKDGAAEALPEGFFDDPVRDARARNVDTPQDLMEREWEEFQKELRQVSSASEAIVAEEDEEGRLERQIDEIDEQIQCFRRVEALRSRQEEVKNVMKRERQKKEETHASTEEEEEEEELEHVLTQDWRAKGALA